MLALEAHGSLWPCAVGKTSTGSSHSSGCSWNSYHQSCSACEEDSATMRKRQEGKAGAQGSALTFQHPSPRNCRWFKDVWVSREKKSKEPFKRAATILRDRQGGEERPLPEPQTQTPPGPSTDHPLEETAWNWAGRLDTAPNGLDNASASGTAGIQRPPSPETLWIFSSW